MGKSLFPINLMKHFSPSHDYVLRYAKNIESAICKGLPLNNKTNDRSSNPDNDPKEVWMSNDLSVGPIVSDRIYTITTPRGMSVLAPEGYFWSLSKEMFQEHLKGNRIWFGSNGKGVPGIKSF